MSNLGQNSSQISSYESTKMLPKSKPKPSYREGVSEEYFTKEKSLMDQRLSGVKDNAIMLQKLSR
jgi:hypothetical protein